MQHGIWNQYTTLPFPFGNLKNQNFLNFIANNNTITSNETKNLNSSLPPKTPLHLALLFNQFNNNAIPENHSDAENVIQNKYYVGWSETPQNVLEKTQLGLFKRI